MATPVAFSADQREQCVRAILSFPAGVRHAVIAAQTGINRETVRRVRYGRLWAQVLPELARLEPETTLDRCQQCVQFIPCRSSVEGIRRGRCALGIPECVTEGPTWARGCGAFSRAS